MSSVISSPGNIIIISSPIHNPTSTCAYNIQYVSGYISIVCTRSSTHCTYPELDVLGFLNHPHISGKHEVVVATSGHLELNLRGTDVVQQ